MGQRIQQPAQGQDDGHRPNSRPRPTPDQPQRTDPAGQGHAKIIERDDQVRQAGDDQALVEVRTMGRKDGLTLEQAVQDLRGADKSVL